MTAGAVIYYNKEKEKCNIGYCNIILIKKSFVNSHFTVKPLQAMMIYNIPCFDLYVLNTGGVGDHVGVFSIVTGLQIEVDMTGVDDQ